MSRPVQEWITDGVALAALGGVLAKVLPTFAALLAVVWYCVLLWESRAGLWWRARWRNFYMLARGHKRLSVEDRVGALVLVLFAAAAAMAIYAIGRVMQL